MADLFLMQKKNDELNELKHKLNDNPEQNETKRMLVHTSNTALIDDDFSNTKPKEYDDILTEGELLTLTLKNPIKTAHVRIIPAITLIDLEQMVMENLKENADIKDEKDAQNLLKEFLDDVGTPNGNFYGFINIILNLCYIKKGYTESQLSIISKFINLVVTMRETTNSKLSTIINGLCNNSIKKSYSSSDTMSFFAQPKVITTNTPDTDFFGELTPYINKFDCLFRLGAIFRNIGTVDDLSIKSLSVGNMKMKDPKDIRTSTANISVKALILNPTRTMLIEVDTKVRATDATQANGTSFRIHSDDSSKIKSIVKEQLGVTNLREVSICAYKSFGVYGLLKTNNKITKVSASTLNETDCLLHVEKIYLGPANDDGSHPIKLFATELMPLDDNNRREVHILNFSDA